MTFATSIGPDPALNTDTGTSHDQCLALPLVQKALQMGSGLDRRIVGKRIEGQRQLERRQRWDGYPDHLVMNL